MKRMLIILVISFLNCSKEKSKRIKIYNSQDFSEKVEIIDTACIKQTKRAEIDIKNNTLYYCEYEYKYGSEEMRELLKSLYNIGYKKFEREPCIRQNNLFRFNCYKKKMNNKVYSILEESKIDSLWEIAELNCYKKYPDSIWIENGEDIRLKFIKKK